MLPIGHYLFLSVALLIIAVAGMSARRNVIVRLLSVELMLVAASINFVAFGRLFDDGAGQLFAIFILATVGAEVFVAFAIFAAVFRRKLATEAEPNRDTWN
jgi:NADH-quinone oxidoreductase subunit K